MDSDGPRGLSPAGRTGDHPPLAFADALRAAIAASGRSLESLRRRLEDRGTPVSIATLSYWQSGRSRPQRGVSLRAVHHLEEILLVPSGHLTSLLTHHRRRPTQRPAPAADLPIDNAHARAALAALGFGPHHEVVDVTVHATLDVDAAGIERVRTIRNVVRAVADGAQRLPALLVLDGPSGPGAEFVAVSGCHLGHQVARPEEGVFAAELLLDKPLRLGETAAAEHRVRFPPGHRPEQYIEYYLLRRVTELMIWVRFSPSRLPRRIQTYSELGGRTTRAEVRLAGSASVQHVLHGVGPGIVGIRWAW